MSTNELVSKVEKMIERAADAKDSNDALKFSQGACNATNAIVNLLSIPNVPKEQVSKTDSKISNMNTESQAHTPFPLGPGDFCEHYELSQLR